MLAWQHAAAELVRFNVIMRRCRHLACVIAEGPRSYYSKDPCGYDGSRSDTSSIDRHVPYQRSENLIEGIGGKYAGDHGGDGSDTNCIVIPKACYPRERPRVVKGGQVENNSYDKPNGSRPGSFPSQGKQGAEDNQRADPEVVVT
nr:hypothetical protein [Arthrobacter crystallopoietes]